MNNKINTLIQQGKFAQALGEFDKALKRTPRDSHLWSNRGIVLIRLGRLNEAKESFFESLKIEDNSQVERNLTNLLIQLNHLEEAQQLNNKQLAKDNNSAPELLNAARIEAGLNKPQQAISIYKKIIHLHPTYIQAYVGYGYLLNLQSQYSEAILINHKALEIDSKCYPAMLNLGVAYNNAKDYKNAVKFLKLCTNSNRNDLKAWLTLAGAQVKMYDTSGARESIEVIHKIDPGNPLMKFQQGALYLNERNYPAAKKEFEDVININGDDVEAHFHLGLVLLGQKDYQNADKEFRFRTIRKNVKYGRFNDFDRKELNYDKPLLIGKEQGVGDEVLLSRLIPALKNHVKKITYICDDRLVNIFEKNYPSINIIGQSEYLRIEPDYDQWQKINLGTIFRYISKPLTEIQKIDKFEVDKESVTNIKKRLPNTNKPRIGISWKSKNADIGQSKSLELDELQEILVEKDYQYINLQYGDVEKEINTISKKGINIYDDKNIDKFNDLDSLFAIASLCDVVVTTSNITAHIAGALKIKVLLILPKYRGRVWYWEDKKKSSWYPSIEIVEQENDGSWSDAISSVKNKLKEMNLLA